MHCPSRLSPKYDSIRSLGRRWSTFYYSVPTLVPTSLPFLLHLAPPPRTPVGIDFEVVFDGNGADYPMDGDIAIVHFKAYAGVGEDAVLFENTRKRKRKFRFKVGAGTVIEGLDMIITKMSLGTKVSVVFPPGLAYGDDGLPPKVPPNTPVHLIVELISFFDDQDSDDGGGEDED